MSEEKRDEPLQQIVLTHLVRLNAVVSGIVAGVILGGGLFLITNWLVLKGGDIVGPHLSLLNQFFIGYTVTFWGSLLGLLYGFVTGFIIGYSIAFLYNRLLNWHEREKG